MQKTIFLFAISFLIFSCGDQPQNEESVNTSKQESSTQDDHSKIGRNTYAVTWKWTTTDSKFVQDNIPAISKELTNLWNEDVVENAYFNTESPVDKLDYFANIAFFLKAHTEKEARSILDQLTVVKKQIASYELHPVGQLWLDRKTDVINQRGITNSFVTVWTTVKSPLEGKNADVLLKKQNDEMLDLWKKGIVENVYFDIEGTYKDNEKTDFVFFVNTNTKEEAEHICNNLPFFKENIASYEVYQAGVFWMGKSNNH